MTFKEYSNLILEFLKKHDQTSTNLTNIFDFIGCLNFVGFDEIKQLCGFTKYTADKYTKMPQSMSVS